VTIIKAMTMPKLPQQKYEGVFVRMLQDSGWEIFRKSSFSATQIYSPRRAI
jgi:hypothetical protein